MDWAPVADAVVVGAGHNGLVAANLLADAGWEVLVLEVTGQPGGSVRTAEVPHARLRKGSSSASWTSWLPGCAAPAPAAS
jgi:phytoene dehydrogenase-like protein